MAVAGLRVSDRYSARVPSTAFNMSGFIQPAFLVEMLKKTDADGFNDRQL